jgi:hypothetical protein
VGALLPVESVRYRVLPSQSGALWAMEESVDAVVPLADTGCVGRRPGLGALVEEQAQAEAVRVVDAVDAAPNERLFLPGPLDRPQWEDPVPS